MMRCNMANMLRQAARCIDPEKDDYGYQFSMEQLVEHIEQVRDGSVTLDEFADFYMLRPETEK